MSWRQSLSQLKKRAFHSKQSGTDYNPKAYWNARPDPNAPEGKTPERIDFDVNYVRKNLPAAASIFELGPGVGRTFAAYESGSSITTLDLSRTYAERLSNVAQEHGLTLDQHFIDDPMQAFPFADGQFSFGVSCQVFIHQPPDVFRHSLREFSRVCQSAVIISGINFDDANTPHVFNHDYLRDLTDLGRLASNVLVRGRILYLYMHKDEIGIL